MDYKKRAEEIVERFSKHVAEYSEVRENLEMLTFKKPGTSVDALWYIRHGGFLFVYGDLGEATYSWSENAPMLWISGLNLGYFHEKCRASEGGACYKWFDWDADVAKESLEQSFKDDEDECEGQERIRFEELFGWNAIHNRDEWYQWVNDNGCEVFGSEFYEWVFQVGEIIPYFCQMHLIGLREAFKESEKVVKFVQGGNGK